jgi:quercetin dioxygenase-like cupin family protein
MSRKAKLEGKASMNGASAPRSKTDRNDLGGSYPAGRRETLAEVEGLRVRLLSLLEGQCVPWHCHSEITDTFFCMRGPIHVLTRNPDAKYILDNGDMLAVPPGTPHFVSGAGSGECQFMIVQGVGTYDYVEIDT